MSSLIDFWRQLFASQQTYLPHAVCLDYGPALWLHAVSDGIIALAYYSIPFALVYFALKREDLRYRWIFGMFGLFILACGTTHFMNIWTLFYPDYLASGAIKAVTAVVSMATAVALWPLLPQALSLPGPRAMEAANAALVREIGEREKAEAMVRASNAVLEQRVRDRTADLERANQALQNEIGQRAAVEQQLRHAKEGAERANLAKSKFLATASHDLRQPVQAMFYFSQALSYRLADEHSSKILADLDRSLEGLKSLLDSLLDMSKLDAGVVVPQAQDFPVNDLLLRAAAEFEPVAGQKGLRLTVMPSSAKVNSDPALLARVVQNLVANAVRYTPQGRILVGCRHRGSCVCIEVWDTGIGIPPDRLAEIFEEFTQVKSVQREEGQGLGLGLAIVRRLCDLLGHRVGVRSQVGKGSLFFVEVPLAGAHARQAA